MSAPQALQALLRERYRPGEVGTLRSFLIEQGAFAFPAFANGLFPAAVPGGDRDESGYSSVWVRDNVYIAYAHHVTGKTELAVRTLGALLAFFHEHRRRFDDILAGRSDPREPMNRPHIRFDGRTLSEIDQKWPHAQNDALGYLLWLLATLGREGRMVLCAADWEVVSLLVSYLGHIRFWEDEDSGHWEEQRKVSASSIGVVTAALQGLEEWAREEESARSFLGVELLEDMIQEGLAALDGILPGECTQDDAQKNRRYDAALLFLIFPLRLVDGAMARQILADVTASLQGEHGIRRYRGDSYWAPDYEDKLAADQRTLDFSDDIGARNRLLGRVGDEAQWCLFDPIVSCIHGLWFEQTGDGSHLEKQTEHLHRSLAQLARTGSGSLRLPELYFLKRGRYVPNDHIPLLWAEANLLVALAAMEQSAGLADKRFPGSGRISARR